MPLEPVVLARARWSGDPCLNAFFGSADDIPAFLGRSKELRAFFDDPATPASPRPSRCWACGARRRRCSRPRFENGMLSGK
jgi:hypothetical protein